jgi:hypothetical protein
MIYGGSARQAIGFGGYRTYEDFKNQVNQAPYLVGPRRIDEAMALAVDSFKNARPNVPKITVLLTTGPQTPVPGSTPLSEAVKPLVDNGIRPYIVAVGREVDQWNLNGAVSKPEDVFPVNNSQQLLPQASPIAKKIAGGAGK